MADETWSGRDDDESVPPSQPVTRIRPQWTYFPWGTTVSYEGFQASFPSRYGRVYGQINNAVRFKSGDLLFNVHPDNICYHFSQQTKRFTYVFELDWGPGTFLWSVAPDRNGNVYCTLSGIRTAPPIVDADFGNWGAVAVVNPRKHMLKTIIEQGPIVDPYSIQIVGSKLVIADFASFGGSGRVYTVDVLTGAVQILAEGDYLLDPTTAFIDDDDVLWIANGDQDHQDGEVVAIDLSSGQRRVVYPKQGPMSGALLGVFRAHDTRHVIATKNEWSQRTKSAVMLINKKTGKSKTLLSASEDEPKFFSTIGCVIGSTLWVAECCDRELLEFDLKQDRILNRYDLTPIMGGHRGMRNSFDAISGLYAVP